MYLLYAAIVFMFSVTTIAIGVYYGLKLYHKK